MAKRQKPTDKVIGYTAQDLSYNDQAGAMKVLGPVMGVLTNLGAAPTASTAMTFSNGSLIALYNTDTATQFIQTSDTAIGSAPLATTGICLPPAQYTIIAIPAGHNFIRSSSAAVIMYLIADDTILQ
jgi:hypothetical protein